MNAYKLLDNFCKVRNKKHAFDIENPVTERVVFINEYLKSEGINYTNNIINIKYRDICNVEVDFNPNIENQKTIVLLAHHDVNNLKSDNMNDNSASVCHLLELAKRIKDIELTKRIVIVFTDLEEFGGAGGGYLGDQIKEGVWGNVDYALNLELTGFGSEIHIEKHESTLSDLILEYATTKETIIHKMSIPFNDSVSIRRYDVDSVCIGLLPMKAINERMAGSYPKEWGLCHSTADKFENANEADMIMFNDFLFDFVKYDSPTISFEKTVEDTTEVNSADPIDCDFKFEDL